MTYLQENVYQLKGRINNHILGVKGLNKIIQPQLPKMKVLLVVSKCNMNATPARKVTPPWDVYKENCDSGWQGYPTQQTKKTTKTSYPTNHGNILINIEWYIYMNRRVSPPMWVNSPTRGPPVTSMQRGSRMEFFLGQLHHW